MKSRLLVPFGISLLMALAAVPARADLAVTPFAGYWLPESAAESYIGDFRAYDFQRSQTLGLEAGSTCLPMGLAVVGSIMRTGNVDFLWSTDMSYDSSHYGVGLRRGFPFHKAELRLSLSYVYRRDTFETNTSTGGEAKLKGGVSGARVGFDLLAPISDSVSLAFVSKLEISPETTMEAINSRGENIRIVRPGLSGIFGVGVNFQFGGPF